MFGFAQWDSPIALILEGLLSVAIVAGLFFVARRVNAQADRDREQYLQSRNGPIAAEKPDSVPPMPLQRGANEADDQ